MDTHNYPFFGQKAGLIIQSPSKNVPYFFIQCIKKKQNNSWEKTSLGEGQKVKFNLNEMVSMLHVLQQKVNKWSTYHKFKETTTQIQFNWKESALWINIGEYSRN